MASAIPVELRRQPLLSLPRIQRVLATIERWALKRAAHVVCSPGLAGYVQNQAPDASVSEWRFPAQLKAVEPREADSLRNRLRIGPERRIVLYSGSFAGYQGVDLLFEAFVRTRESNPELLLVCVGATDSEMTAWAKRIPPELQEHIRIIPRQPRERIATYIELADFLALPRGRTDNVPLKLFDYMASGKPIIATRHSAHDPLLDQTRAFLCDPTPQALADAISRACRSPQEAESVARASRRYADRQFAWGRFVDFVRATYANSIFAGRQAAALKQAG
jgi:glycosyltransferase involved in cell wall biosynthesis